MEIINHSTSGYILGLGHGTCAFYLGPPHAILSSTLLSPLLCFLLAKPEHIEAPTCHPISIVVITPPLFSASQPYALA